MSSDSSTARFALSGPTSPTPEDTPEIREVLRARLADPFEDV